VRRTLIEAMPGQLLSINAFLAGRDNLCVSVELATRKRKATMKISFGVLCGVSCLWFGNGTMAMAGDGVVTSSTPVRIGVYDSGET
jgi:hypothetical protein